MLKVDAGSKRVHPKLLGMLVDTVKSFYQCSQFQMNTFYFEPGLIENKI